MNTVPYNFDDPIFLASALTDPNLEKSIKFGWNDGYMLWRKIQHSAAEKLLQLSEMTKNNVKARTYTDQEPWI